MGEDRRHRRGGRHGPHHRARPRRDRAPDIDSSSPTTTHGARSSPARTAGASVVGQGRRARRHAAPRAPWGAFGVINAVQHQFNLPVMEAPLAPAATTPTSAACSTSRASSSSSTQFKKKGLLALLGIGAAPGIVNVLARAAADAMEQVHEIHIPVGGIDRTPSPRTPLGTSYSMVTILDEASLPAALFTGGSFAFVQAMSGAEVDFPGPVGVRRPASRSTPRSRRCRSPTGRRACASHLPHRLPRRARRKAALPDALGLISESRSRSAPGGRAARVLLAGGGCPGRGRLRPTSTRSCA